MDPAEVERWFAGYLDAFAACGRGEAAAESMLGHYAVPLLVSSDDGARALMTEDDVVDLVRHQVDGMVAADYDHSDVLELEVTPLNAATASCRGRFSRRRRDGEEISRLAATYLVVDTPAGRRIAALSLHTPE